MHELLNPPLRLGISAAAVSLWRRQRWSGAPLARLAEVAIVPSEDGSFAALGSGLDQLFTSAGRASRAGAALQVVLADDLARFWQVTPPPQALRLADLDAAAALRFQSLYGEPLSGWTMQADRTTRTPYLAVALPQALLDVVQRAALAHRLTIVGSVPQFIQAWNSFCKRLKPGAWFGVVHGALLTIGVIDGTRLCAVRAIALPSDADAAWLAGCLGREALLLGLTAPVLLQACGPVPAALRSPGAIRCEVLEPPRAQGAALSLASLLALSGARP